MALNIWNLLVEALVIILYLNLATGKSLVKPPWVRPKPNPKLLQNNIILDNSIVVPTCTTKDAVVGKQLDESGTGAKRNGVINPRLRWNEFYVLPDPQFEQWELDIIGQAMWNLLQVIPCVNFGIYNSSAEPTGDYVRLVKGKNNGCNSYVGRQGGGRQDINLQSPGCINVGTVMHELLHALGFYHEHCRYDRDDFITINWDNVQPEFKFAFDKKFANETTVYSVPYNYNSIMHYGERAFTKNGMPTMVAKNGQRMGSTGELQDSDVQKLKRMYSC